MTYVELDLEDELYEELRTLAEEEGVAVEDLIIDILKDEFSLPHGEDEAIDEDDIDEEGDLADESFNYDDEN
jgi:hypothetical protein